MLVFSNLFDNLQSAVGKLIIPINLPNCCWPVLLHNLWAMSINFEISNYQVQMSLNR